MYLHNFVNNLGCTLENVFDNDEECIFVERFISVDMSLINELGDLLVGQGEQTDITSNFLFHSGNGGFNSSDQFFGNACHGDIVDTWAKLRK